VNGTAQSRIENIRFKNIDVKFDRWTKYPGGVYDNRPTKVLTPIEAHAADGFNVRYADNIFLENCLVSWKRSSSTNFSNAIGTEEVSGLKVSDFSGDSAAHPIFIR
jgi:hypothetical protein